MWLAKLNDMKKTTRTKTKALADQIHRSERTVTRMLAGESSIDMTELQTMVAYMGGSLDDIFDGSDFKLPKPEIDALKKDIEVLSEENAILRAEIAVLKDKIVALDAENDRLRLTLEHKDDLLSLHKYYMTLLKAGD